MPDHKVCLTRQRTAELQEFDDLAASWGHESSVGVVRRTSSLLGDRCEFSRLSSAFLAKDFDVKPSSLCTAPDIVTEASPRNALLITSQSCPLTKKERSSFVATEAEATAAADDSGSKLSTSSRRIAPRGRPALKAQSRALKAVKPENVEIVAESRPRPRPRPSRQYRGVRVRPGVKGFLVEIRPRRWKKTIWLGTYTTSPEAARAFDAGIFYTGKNIPFNFQESKGTFPPLPEHLSIANSDPEVMNEIKWFVKEQALKAAKRGGEELPTQERAVVPPQHTCNTSDKEGRSSVGLQYRCCSTLFSGKEEAGEHDVKDDEDHDDGRCDPLVTPNPLQNLEPLPYNLPHCSKQGFCHNDRDFFSGGMPLAVHEYMLPHASMVGDDDLLNSMQQISCLTEQVLLSSTWRHGNEHMQQRDEEAGFQSAFGSKSDGNFGILSLDSQEVQSLGLHGWDPSLGDRLSLVNFDRCDPYAYPQAQKFPDCTFAMTHPENPFVLHQNWEGASSMSVCTDSMCLSLEESKDDDELPVWLWPNACSRDMVG